ncbi:MAG: hypothetical protein GXP59_06045 [Deltaproteobacteria bacterium]|nr:hypothetical protein [Deltaproteobacteria bacterium]
MTINKLLEDRLKNAMGLNLRALGTSTLKNAVSRRMRCLRIEDRESYYNLVICKRSEINELIDEIAINETWFFRDNGPFAALQKYAGNWLKSGVGSSLRLLSIPCSTGEEPYSMAISLLEAGIPASLFAIDAIDISNRALAHAKRGIFDKQSFRGRNRIFQNQYFKKHKAGHIISEKIKNSVRFFRGNLLDMRLFVTGAQYDIIFCRNLLIYFDDHNQKRAIANLDELLTADGVIFTGHAEPGIFAGSGFIPSSFPMAFALTRKSAAASNNQPDSGLRAAAGRFTIPAEEETLAFKSLDFAAIQSMAEAEHYEEAIAMAEKYCKDNAPSPHIFFLMARIFVEMANLRQAAKMLKKALYLDPNFLEAIKLLVVIYKRQGDETNSLAFELRSQRVEMRLTAEKSC